MEKVFRKRFLIIAVTVSLAAVIIIITLGIVAKTKKQNPESWILKINGNTVALYNNSEIEEVFADIVVDTLPEDDLRQLENGIAFTTREEAIHAIEDYDG